MHLSESQELRRLNSKLQDNNGKQEITLQRLTQDLIDQQQTVERTKFEMTNIRAEAHILKVKCKIVSTLPYLEL